jgi:hypothetical protein
MGVENANGMNRMRERIYIDAHTRPILSGLPRGQKIILYHRNRRQTLEFDTF